MSLLEIHAAAETADTSNAAIPQQNPNDSGLQRAQDREERLAKHALASAGAGEGGGGGDTGDLGQTGAVDERREEAVWDWEDDDDGGGAGGRARQRMRAGGREREEKSGREADLSVRYLMTKVSFAALSSLPGYVQYASSLFFIHGCLRRTLPFFI